MSTIDNIEKTIKHKHKEKEDSIYFPTGSDLLDLVVGGGLGHGYKGKRIINIVGDKSSGKSFLACELIAAARSKYKDKLIWSYDDCESGFSFDTRAIYGFEIMPRKIEDRVRSETVEDGYCNIRNFLERLRADQYGIYVLDSLDGLDSAEGEELANERYNSFKKNKEFKKGSYRMGKPKYLSQEFFPKIAELAEKKNTLIVIISQVRDNVDPMSFDKYTRSGGKAMDFFAHTVLWLAQVSKIKVKDRAVGIVVKARTTKSKTPRPYREAFFNILFDYGIDNIGSNIDYLFDFINDRGKYITNPTGQFGGEEVTIKGIKQFLIDNNIEKLYRKSVNSLIKKDEAAEWIINNEDKKLARKFKNKFGSSMNRKELIEYIEKNEMRKDLTLKVRDKWETIEASIRTERAPKYK